MSVRGSGLGNPPVRLMEVARPRLTGHFLNRQVGPIRRQQPPRLPALTFPNQPIADAAAPRSRTGRAIQVTRGKKIPGLVMEFV